MELNKELNFKNQLNIIKKYLNKKKYKKALLVLEELKQNYSDNIELYYYYFLVYKFRYEYNLARFFLNKTLRLSKNDIGLLLELSTFEIMQKNFEIGWQLYEYRFLLDSYKNELLFSFDKKKLWNSESLDEKTLIILTEQGFGDNIEFIRFIKLIKKRYNRVKIFFYCRKEQVKLFSLVSDIDNVKELNSDIVEYDYFIPIMSLINRLDLEYKDIPSQYEFNKYFKLDKNKKYLNIGLCMEVSGYRKSEFENVSDYFNTKLVTDKRVKYHILDNKFLDFYDTAEYLMKLDLVISVDTAIVHLSASLGIPTYVIISSQSGYLWFNDEKKSIWYKSIKLFREKEGNWNRVFKDINRELKKDFFSEKE